jgi:uncharacterized membrane protein YoaK (UPF0700 family)
MVKDSAPAGWLATLLSFNGGYVDTAGFMALHGLFTAHVTGNFVTLGASLVFGTSGTIAKLLALPVFCLVIVLTRLFAHVLRRNALPVMRIMLSLKLVLLVIVSFLALRYGPFRDGDSDIAILMGMTLVSAMAIQNAAHRVHLAQMPPSTLMTGTTTQIMLDVADLIHGLDGEAASQLRARLGRMSLSVVSFALGCAGAALFYGLGKELSFLVPPVLGVLMLAFNVA